MPEPLRLVQTGVEIDAGATAGAIAIVRGLSEFELSTWRTVPATVLAYAISDDGHAGATLLMPDCTPKRFKDPLGSDVEKRGAD